MNELEFIKQLETKGITLTPQQVNQFKQYFKILVEWNEKMNLTAITDEEGVYLKHFYDSLTIAFDFDFTDQNIVDVGAGAGFPSVPLKIVYPELKITIVDSLTKRITFLNHLFKELNLSNCQAISARAEDYAKDHRQKCDIVMARAVARLALKGLKATEELEEAGKGIVLLGGQVEKSIDFTLTNDNHRSNIIIKKVRDTPAKYPRMFGKIKKQPL